MEGTQQTKNDGVHGDGVSKPPATRCREQGVAGSNRGGNVPAKRTTVASLRVPGGPSATWACHWCHTGRRSGVTWQSQQTPGRRRRTEESPSCPQGVTLSPREGQVAGHWGACPGVGCRSGQERGRRWAGSPRDCCRGRREGLVHAQCQGVGAPEGQGRRDWDGDREGGSP
jgi:hypothetical protein